MRALGRPAGILTSTGCCTRSCFSSSSASSTAWPMGAASKRNSTLLASNCAISAASPTSPFRRSLSSLMMVRLRQAESKLLWGFLVLALLLGVCSAVQAQQKPEQLAQQSADAWLALVDSGKYADSWQEAAQLFKAAVSKEKWRDALRGTRDPLGKMLSRKLKSATYAKTLPGAPDGEYVVIQYESSFEHKQLAVETVTPMLDKDGQWRVSGYYIK